MVSEKISAMPAATSMTEVDVVPVVQDGVNKKCDRHTLLLVEDGEEGAITSNGGAFVGLDNDGSAGCYDANGTGFYTSEGDAGAHVNGAKVVLDVPLPTTDPLSAGQLWNSLGTVKISGS